jgi:hypothetical protein
MEEPKVRKRRFYRYKPAQRVAYVKQWRESGKTQRVFCAEQGLNIKSLSNWSMRMKHLLAAENNDLTPGKVSKTKKKPSGFVAIKVKPAESKIENTERSVALNGCVFAKVKTPGGVVINLYKEVPAEYLRNIAHL